ncbi:MAG: hypothetical protein WDW36_002475 [Sanguina aurantia]
MLCPNMWCISVLLSGPGRACVTRIAMDSADTAASTDPPGQTSRQVHKRISALAVRVVRYYTLRATADSLVGPGSGTQQPHTPHTDAQQQPRTQQQQPQQQNEPQSHQNPTPQSHTEPPSQLPPPIVQPPFHATARQSQSHSIERTSGTGLDHEHSRQQQQQQQQQSPDAAALEDLLLWLATYQQLFSSRCAETGQLLANDPAFSCLLPPIFREFKLPREQLRRLALQPSLVPCWHMHVAPAHMLGWSEQAQPPTL